MTDKPEANELALEYHRSPTPGKLKITATKPLEDQQDLSLAYSPGVAAASRAIAADPAEAANLTIRSNLLGVITNGTAVLGLGNIGPLAAKPVMEGKAVLFQKFAGINVFDIEVDAQDPDRFIDIVASLEPTFGGINLEDIKAPECFEIERRLTERMKIPVFHDDQHGTAIIVSAAITNGLQLVGKSIHDVKLVTSGAGAAALSCVNLLCSLGMQRENITLTDLEGVVHKGREALMDQYKDPYAKETPHRTLAEAIQGADIFLGLSAGNVLKPEMVAAMAEKPLVLALANPDPEILPDEVKKVRDDAIIATGRSDFPNQVNNVLCFPFIFRGALDVGATTINNEMKIACVRALADLAKVEGSDVVSSAYGGEVYNFGPEYIIPKPFDPRLLYNIAPVVAQAAMDSGVATRPIENMEAYTEKLKEFVYRTAMVMRPIFNQAKKNIQRIALAEGEDERVLQAAQYLLDEKIAQPILIGRPEVIAKRVKKLGLRFQPGADCEVIDPNNDVRFGLYWKTYHTLLERRGISPDAAKMHVRTKNTVIGSLALHLGDADALLCGTIGRFSHHIDYIRRIFHIDRESDLVAAMGVLIRDAGPLFVCDLFVNPDPTPEQLAEMTNLAANQVKRFGIHPKIALLSHSSFGSSLNPSAAKMRDTFELIRSRFPDLEVEGEMQSDAALSEKVREQAFPNSLLKGTANLLIMPCLDSAHISFNLAKSLENSLNLGPVLLGTTRPAHILTPSVTTRGIINMCALAAVDAQFRAKVTVEG